jgi:hypothetical protein
MSSLQVKKVVAVCFLEAARMTLEHVTAHRLATAQHTAPDGNQITRLYGDVRRLRDYLQRCVSAQHDLIELDLAPDDSGLLVACCRRAVEVIDDRLEGGLIIPPDERRWLDKKRQVLADWAVEIAQKPLVELPLPRPAEKAYDFGRGLLARLRDKIYGDVSQRAKIAAPTSGILSAGASPFEDGSASEPPPDEVDYAPASPSFGLPGSEQPLMASQQIRDHRLRSLVALDLYALNRARESKDHRVATVLLASILEAAVLDHALARREQLALSGTPDLWNPAELLEAIVGESFAARDRTLAYHLFTSRNLLRPALQLVTPVLVTPGSFQQLLEFTQRSLHAMGFATGNPTEGVSAQS